ncbi:unnamed protein product [Coccothraustes coccothraustes]
MGHSTTPTPSHLTSEPVSPPGSRRGDAFAPPFAGSPPWFRFRCGSAGPPAAPAAAILPYRAPASEAPTASRGAASNGVRSLSGRYDHCHAVALIPVEFSGHCNPCCTVTLSLLQLSGHYDRGHAVTLSPVELSGNYDRCNTLALSPVELSGRCNLCHTVALSSVDPSGHYDRWHTVTVALARALYAIGSVVHPETVIAPAPGHALTLSLSQPSGPCSRYHTVVLSLLELSGL